MATIDSHNSSTGLDVVFAALADPARRAIVAKLARGEATVGEVALPLDMALPSVSKHVRVLERARLIERRVDGRRHWLRLSPTGWRAAADYVEGYRWFWESSLDRLSDLASALAESPTEGDT